MASKKEKARKAGFAILRPGKFMQSLADEKAAAEQLKHAEEMRQESFDLANQLNWEPDYVSDLVQPYQKTQSPLARSFLESLLTGANPSMVSSTRHGANRLQAGAQARFDDQFGGWDQLLARQREVDKQTPWAPKTYGHAPAVVKLPEPQAPEAPAPVQFTPADTAALGQYGVRLGPDGTPGAKFQAAAQGMGLPQLSAEDYKRIAAAIQAGDMDLARRIQSGQA